MKKGDFINNNGELRKWNPQPLSVPLNQFISGVWGDIADPEDRNEILRMEVQQAKNDYQKEQEFILKVLKQK
ncbi:hypothetical protein N9L92_00380 [Saprospiraceae bacterium]|nr:hypothetical protein [Saprospiraceae bacterium]